MCNNDLRLSQFRKVKLKLNGLDKIDKNNKYWRLKIGNLKKYKDMSFKDPLKCERCNKKDIRNLEFHHVADQNGKQKGGVTHQQQIKKELNTTGYDLKLMLLCKKCHSKIHKGD